MPKVLHARYSGYFPACIQVAPTSKQNLVGGTLEQIMELYWRVKTWRLDSVSGTTSTNYAGGASNQRTYTASQQTLGSVNATSETNLVCNPYPFFSATANYLGASVQTSMAGTVTGSADNSAAAFLKAFSFLVERK